MYGYHTLFFTATRHGVFDIVRVKHAVDTKTRFNQDLNGFERIMGLNGFVYCLIKHVRY